MGVYNERVIFRLIIFNNDRMGVSNQPRFHLLSHLVTVFILFFSPTGKISAGTVFGTEKETQWNCQGATYSLFSKACVREGHEIHTLQLNLAFYVKQSEPHRLKSCFEIYSMAYHVVSILLPCTGDSQLSLGTALFAHVWFCMACDLGTVGFCFHNFNFILHIAVVDSVVKHEQ